MRRLLAGVTAALLAGCGGESRGEPAPWAFERLAPHISIPGPVWAGDELLVGGSRGGRATLTAYGPNGARMIPLPGSEYSVGELAASERAFAVTTGTNTPASGSFARRSSVVPAGFGPPKGPLQQFDDLPAGVAVAGPYVLAFENLRGDGKGVRLTGRNVEEPGAPVRPIPLPAGAVTGILDAAGDYAAIFAGIFPDSRIVVVDVRTGAEVYRVRARVVGWGLGPDGRVVLLERGKGGARVVTATPGAPARRELTRMRLATPRVSVTPNGAAVVRAVGNGLGEIVLVGYDGSVRPLTPALNYVNELDFDGTRLAFNAGNCVFAGPIPAGPPADAPRDSCFDVHASLDFPWMVRRAQTRGRALKVGLRCEAPPRARCPASLRLSGPGFTVRRKVRIPPGLHAVRIGIPARQRRAAWREGMYLVTLERGRATSGAAIPQ